MKPSSLQNGGEPGGLASRRSAVVFEPAVHRGVLAAVARIGASLACFVALAVPSVAADAPEVTPRLVIYGPVAGVGFHGPSGIAIDARRGELLLANTGDHRIEVYGFNGRLHTHFTHKVRTRDGRILMGEPAQLLVDPAGHTLVLDQLAAYVDVLDFRGRLVARLDLSSPAAGALASNIIGGMTVAPSGDIFVASGGDTARVYRFDARYRLRACWTATGENGTRLSAVRGIAVLPDGRLVLTATVGRPVVNMFAPSGEFVRGFGRHEVGPGNFSNPSGVVATADGRIWVSDEIRQTIQVFDSTGSFLGTMTGARDLEYPSALATDGREYLAVAERLGNRFQLLKIH